MSSTIIVGSTGYIGRQILARLTGQANTIATSRTRQSGRVLFDLACPESFDYSLVREGDLIILVAAISSPDVCANQWELAYSVNVTGTARFVERCLDLKACVLFFSSDTVYGASDAPVDESAPPQPAGEYAQMKARLEQHYLGHPGFKVFRLSYVFSKQDRFTQYLEDCATSGRRAEIFHPFNRRVVHRDDVVDAAIRMRQAWHKFDSPIVNVGGPELLSRIDVANCYRDIVDPRLQFSVVEPPPEFFAARPKTINMSARNFELALGRPPRSIRQAMEIEFNRS